MAIKELISLGPEAVRDRIEGRLTLLLDINYWINLVESPLPQVRECVALLTEAVESGRLLCPVAAPNLWELKKQHYDSAAPIADLMDRMSGSVAFASSDEIYEAEIRDYITRCLGVDYKKFDARGCLVPVVSYLSTKSALGFQESRSSEDRRRMVEMIPDALRSLTIRQLIDMTKDSMPVQESWEPPGYSSVLRKRAEIAKGDKKNAWLEEAAGVYQTTFSPVVAKLQEMLPVDDQLKIVEVLSRLEPDNKGRRLVSLFEKLPYLLARVEVATLSGLDFARRDKVSDFYDREILGAPYVCADAFASEDRWIRHILRSEPVVMRKWPTVFLPNLGEIISWTKKIMA